MQLKAALAQMRARPVVDRAAVDQLVDAAMADGKLTKSEQKALEAFVADRADAFDDPGTRQRLEAFLTIVDDKVRSLAYRLERDDGVIDLGDMDKLLELGGDYRELSAEQVYSLRAVMLGARLGGGVRRNLEAELHGTSDVRTLDPAAGGANQARLELAPLRTRAFDDAGQLKLVGYGEIPAAAALDPGSFHGVDAAQLTKALKQARAARTRDLKKSGSVDAPPGRVLPEDGSLRIKNVHMALVGADQTYDDYLVQMAQIGKVEGFHVVVRSPGDPEELRKEYEKLGLDNVVVVSCTGKGDFWSEDQGELDTAGNVRVPAPVLAGVGEQGVKDYYAALYEDRLRRLRPDVTITGQELMAMDPGQRSEKYGDVLFAAVGQVLRNETHEVLATVALAQDNKLIAAEGHIEGGNLLVGTHADGRGYALVGKDSLAASRFLLERDLGREVSDAELKERLARDLGVAPADVHGIEQPGDFHLDMHMIPVKPGEVVLNDCVEAAALQARWWRDDHEAEKPTKPPANASKEAKKAFREAMASWKELGGMLEERIADLAEKAKKRAPFEEKARADLEAAGMKVHRMAGVFETGHMQSMNFLNLEQAVNARGERFAILLGGDPRAERYVAEKLNGEVGCGYARLHFLARENTQTTLQAMGGISCRVKLEGEIVAP